MRAWPPPGRPPRRNINVNNGRVMDIEPGRAAMDNPGHDSKDRGEEGRNFLA